MQVFMQQRNGRLEVCGSTHSKCRLSKVYIGISETLHDEISPLGLRSVCVDFGYFRTSFLEAEQRAPKVSRIPDYKETSDKVEAALQGLHFP